jgi:hypothetical protein
MNLPSNDEQNSGGLAAQIAQAERVRCLSLPERRVLFETTEETAIAQLAAALTTVPGEPFHCMCLGTLVVEAEASVPVSFTVHHGVSVRVGRGAEGDLALRDPAALMGWLTAHGMPFVQEEYDDAARAGARTRLAAEAWRAQLPASLAPFFEEMQRSGGTSRPEWTKAVEAELADPVERARRLLDLFGGGVGPWNGVPSWELVPEALLLGLPLEVLLSAVGEAPPPERRQGAARLFCGWHFNTRRKHDRLGIPKELGQMLLRHVEATGDDAQVRAARSLWGPR